MFPRGLSGSLSGGPGFSGRSGSRSGCIAGGVSGRSGAVLGASGVLGIVFGDSGGLPAGISPGVYDGLLFAICEAFYYLTKMVCHLTFRGKRDHRLPGVPGDLDRAAAVAGRMNLDG